jgi:hypothetical protein
MLLISPSAAASNRNQRWRASSGAPKRPEKGWIFNGQPQFDQPADGFGQSFQPLGSERSIQKASDDQEKAFGLLGVTFFHGIHNQQ